MPIHHSACDNCTKGHKVNGNAGSELLVRFPDQADVKQCRLKLWFANKTMPLDETPCYTCMHAHMHTRMRTAGCMHAQRSQCTQAYLAVVLICVEHDGGVGQDVDHIRVLKQLGALHVVPCSKALHDAVDLLRLSR